MFSTFESIEVFQPLSLVHVGMKDERRAAEKSEDGAQSTDTVLAVSKHQRPAGKLTHKVVQTQVFILHSASETRFRQ